MIDRDTARQLERFFARSGTNADRVARHARGLLLLLQLILGSLVTVKGLWDNGFGQQLDAAADNSIVNGATKRWWKLAQAAFLLYTIFMKTPFSVLAALTLDDGQGNVTHPFAVFDPTTVGELSQMSFEQIAFSEPETTLLLSEPIIPEEIP